MCLGGGGGGYTPAPIKKPVYQAGPESPDDMVNNQVIENANPRDQQEAARNEFTPFPNRPQLKPQSSVSLGGTTTPEPVKKRGGMGQVARNARSKRLRRRK